MNKLFQTGLVILAVVAVAVADVMIKKIFTPRTTFWTDLANPLMWVVAALYLGQILIFAYLFDRNVELGIVGIIQTALYAAIVVGSGILFFNEDISLVQGIGIGLAMLGVVLMNL